MRAIVPLFLLAACSPAQWIGDSPRGEDRMQDEVQDETPAAWFGQSNQSLRIPGGEKCLAWLSKLGIAHERLDARPSVETPVRITGPIARVRYVSQGEDEIVADCRLILALDWVGPSLRELGVRRVRHSGAYVFRTQKSGRPSLHAQGLAIDLHSFDIAGRESGVERDFERGLGDGCEKDAPEVNRVVCRLRRLHLFQELITPDHDRDHHDHVHIAISPRAS